ncbi:hypothetical protein ACVBEF_21295, partial [Glaciimonas sp. GG7]
MAASNDGVGQLPIQKQRQLQKQLQRQRWLRLQGQKQRQKWLRLQGQKQRQRWLRLQDQKQLQLQLQLWLRLHFKNNCNINNFVAYSEKKPLIKKAAAFDVDLPRHMMLP